MLVGSLNPIGGMFEHAFNIQELFHNNEAIVSVRWKIRCSDRADYGVWDGGEYYRRAGLPALKYIFLTGHHTFYMACMIGVILTVAGFEG